MNTPKRTIRVFTAENPTNENNFMESTNHNLWTLTKHVAQSINKTAGKIDAKIYGPTNAPTTNAIVEVSPTPVTPEEPTNIIGWAGGIVTGIFAVVCLVFWISKWQGRAERVGNKIWGE